jgi:hypothetical protein
MTASDRFAIAPIQRSLRDCSNIDHILTKAAAVCTFRELILSAVP